MEALVEDNGPEQGEAPDILDAIKILWYVEDRGDERVEGRERRGVIVGGDDVRSGFAAHHDGTEWVCSRWRCFCFSLFVSAAPRVGIPSSEESCVRSWLGKV